MKYAIHLETKGNPYASPEMQWYNYTCNYYNTEKEWLTRLEQYLKRGKFSIRKFKEKEFYLVEK